MDGPILFFSWADFWLTLILLFAFILPLLKCHRSFCSHRELWMSSRLTLHCSYLEHHLMKCLIDWTWGRKCLSWLTVLEGSVMVTQCLGGCGETTQWQWEQVTKAAYITVDRIQGARQKGARVMYSQGPTLRSILPPARPCLQKFKNFLM